MNLRYFPFESPLLSKTIQRLGIQLLNPFTLLSIILSYSRNHHPELRKFNFEDDLILPKSKLSLNGQILQSLCVTFNVSLLKVGLSHKKLFVLVQNA